ncbi:MAG: cation diffusion facilitator family transporter, partial [Bergeyella zoohelcum]|nr:cation diffusion facilitator family transporter [Bergeyella zoohelcum]
TNTLSFSFQRTIAIIGILLFIAKLVAWRLTQSDAIFSDAMESIVNIIAGLMGLYSLFLSAKPKDQDHPYGHGKIEFVTSAIEGALIIFAGLMILMEASASFFYPKTLQELNWGMGIIGLTAIVNYILGYMAFQKGTKENSLVLQSTGKHLQSDTISTLGVVLSLLLVKLTNFYWLDALIAVLLGGYIIVEGYKIIRKAFSGIMDEKDEALVAELVQALKQDRRTEWIDIHNMKVQQFGAHLHIDAHITLPHYYSLSQAHREMESVITTLLKHTKRTMEFNFHMDDCKPFSCEICQIDCPVRSKPFVKTIDWTTENISQVQKHSVENA